MKFLAVLAMLAAGAAQADQCQVVAITDGDTLKAMCATQVNIRLAEIDAPEKRQAFGSAAKQALSDICFGKMATITQGTKDRYGRTVARVSCEGVDANAEMVRRGMAWAYVAYQHDPQFSQYERDARSQRLGLWADATPIPPWDWRRKKASTN